MEIHPPLTSQLLYGDNGRAVLPLNIFLDNDMTNNPSKTGGKTPNSEKNKHLGVPLIIAVIEKPSMQTRAINNCMHIPDTYAREPMHENAIKIVGISGNSVLSHNDYVSENPTYIMDEHRELGPSQFHPIRDDVFDQMFFSIADGKPDIEQIEKTTVSKPSKKTTRKKSKKHKE